MVELFKQFFSFKKLMKDRLVASFFYLGLLVIIVSFFSGIITAFKLMPDSFMAGFMMLIAACFSILFLFIGLRLACEMMVTLFRINDNLSPDGGKSDTADIDVFESAKGATSKVAKSASSATKSVVEKTKSKLNELHDDDDDYADYEDVTPKKSPARKKATAKKSTVKKTPAKKTAAKKAPAKKVAAKKKPAARKTPAKK